MADPSYPSSGRKYYTKEEYKMIKTISHYRAKIEEISKVHFRESLELRNSYK